MSETERVRGDVTGGGGMWGWEARIFCGDLLMTPFKQRRRDFAVGKSQQQKWPGF